MAAAINIKAALAGFWNGARFCFYEMNSLTLKESSFWAMKKTIIILVFMLSCSFIGKAQTGFIGGGFTLFYSDGLLYQTTIHGGYEFNDRMAVMAMAGIAYGNGSVVGEVGTY